MGRRKREEVPRSRTPIQVEVRHDIYIEPSTSQPNVSPYQVGARYSEGGNETNNFYSSKTNTTRAGVNFGDGPESYTNHNVPREPTAREQQEAAVRQAMQRQTIVQQLQTERSWLIGVLNQRSNPQTASQSKALYTEAAIVDYVNRFQTVDAELWHQGYGEMATSLPSDTRRLIEICTDFQPYIDDDSLEVTPTSDGKKKKRRPRDSVYGDHRGGHRGHRNQSH